MTQPEAVATSFSRRQANSRRALEAHEKFFRIKWLTPFRARHSMRLRCLFKASCAAEKNDCQRKSDAFGQVMNKAGLIEFVRNGMGKDASRAAADRVVSLVIDGLKVGLQKDKSVQLVGFGTFKVVARKARAGVHPKTLQPLTINQSRNVRFTIGKELKSGI